MIAIVPWVIGGVGLGICFLWRDGTPNWVAGKENRNSDYGYSMIAIVFGIGALYSDRKITGFSDGYIIETGALLVYWLICRGIMGGPK
jgi:hypothetical protein